MAVKFSLWALPQAVIGTTATKFALGADLGAALLVAVGGWSTFLERHVSGRWGIW
jgi:hypothetical protein